MQCTIIGFTEKGPWRDNHVQFIFLSVCSSETHVWDSNECVCTTDYYETAAANETAAPVCTACPPESTTEGSTNSSACGKHSIIIILILSYSMLLYGLWHWYYISNLLHLFSCFWWIERTMVANVVNISEIMTNY